MTVARLDERASSSPRRVRPSLVSAFHPILPLDSWNHVYDSLPSDIRPAGLLVSRRSPLPNPRDEPHRKNN